VAGLDDANPTAGVLFGDPPVDVSDLWEPTPDYVVLGLAQNQRYPRDGRTIPTVDVTYRVPGYPGEFLLRIDNYAFLHADPLLDMRVASDRIRALYALPGEPPAERPSALSVVA
jgi:hypothetical protein